MLLSFSAANAEYEIFAVAGLFAFALDDILVFAGSTIELTSFCARGLPALVLERILASAANSIPNISILSVLALSAIFSCTDAIVDSFSTLSVFVCPLERIFKLAASISPSSSIVKDVRVFGALGSLDDFVDLADFVDFDGFDEGALMNERKRKPLVLAV